MFNGIIFNKGTLIKTFKRSKGINVFIKSDLKLYSKDIGVSVACDGVCLTLISIKNKMMEFYLSNETILRSKFKYLKNKDLRSLSGGEFQRVLMARAIAKKPELLVLDEPVQGVDFSGEIALYELIKKISEELNCGILLISHDLNVVMSKTDYVVCLNGHVCCSGTPMNVANNKNYKELFGDQASTLLSVYEHKHDHTHSTDGSINEKKH